MRKGYFLSKQASRKNLYEKLGETIKQNRMAELGTLLNIGSGGEIAEQLSSHGLNTTSIDIDPERSPDIVGSIEDMHQVLDSSVDAVFCLEVLEHVRNPFLAAKEITRVLKPGGLLVGSTPFCLGEHDSPHDYFRYTRYGLIHLFSQLQEIAISPRNNVFEAATVLPMRLYAVGTSEEKNKLAYRLPLIKLANLIYKIAGRGINNTEATTGYFFTFQKPIRIDHSLAS